MLMYNLFVSVNFSFVDVNIVFVIVVKSRRIIFLENLYESGRGDYWKFYIEY